MKPRGNVFLTFIVALLALDVAGMLRAAAPSVSVSADELPQLLASSGGTYSVALRHYYLDRAERELRSSAKVPAETWTWLAAHPEIRDGLLSSSYPVPARYVENLATLRAALGPAISDKYPHLILAMSLRKEAIDAPNDESPTRSDDDDVDDDADEEDAVMPAEAVSNKQDPRVSKVVAYMKADNRSLVDVVKDPEPVFKELGLDLPRPGGRRALWDQIALASGTYPPRQNLPLVDYLKLIISRYEAPPPEFKSGPRWPIFPLDKAPWPLLLPLKPIPRNEADWVWDLFTGRIKLPNGKRLMTYGTYTWNYQKPEVRYRSSPYNPESIQRIVEDGGVCTRMSSLAQISYRSLGQPASGVGQPGHATLFFYDYDEASDRYVTRVPVNLHPPFHTHARWYIPEIDGFRANPKNNIVGIEYHHGLALAIDAGLDRYVDTRIACHLAAMLPDSAREQKIRLLGSVVTENPYNVEVWYALGRLCQNEPARVNALVAQIERTLSEHAQPAKTRGPKRNPELKLTRELAGSANAMANVICSEIMWEAYSHGLNDRAKLAQNYKLLQTEIARRHSSGLQYDPEVLNLLLRYQLALNGIAGVKDRLTVELCDAIRDDKRRKSVGGLMESVRAALPYLDAEEKFSWLQTLRNAFPPGKEFIPKRNGETVPDKLYEQLYQEQVKALRKLGAAGVSRLRALQNDFNAKQTAAATAARG